MGTNIPSYSKGYPLPRDSNDDLSKIAAYRSHEVQLQHLLSGLNRDFDGEEHSVLKHEVNEGMNLTSLDKKQIDSILKNYPNRIRYAYNLKFTLL